MKELLTICVIASLLLVGLAIGVGEAQAGQADGSGKYYIEGLPKRERFGFTADDPLYTGGQPGNTYGQWHLNGNNGYPSINVAGAWNANYTGSGVVIGIVDDSFETAHVDLAPNYVSEFSYNFGSYIGQSPSDPNPVHSDDQHGISVAGVAAARGGNGIGVSGVAPYAGLAALRIDWPGQTDAMFADATTWRSDVIKVKNHSYGYSQSYVYDQSMVTANRSAAAAGVINVRAAGNDSSNANAKSAQNDRTALTVAALGPDGTASYYSNFGACVFVTAPSNSIAGPGITTTDRSGGKGYGGITGYDDYTNAFGGTSSASPTVAGVVALILEANPNLDIRGVKHVLAETSQKVDPSDPGWHGNGAGYDFNPKYGFGLVDASAAVEYAATYSAPGAETSFGTGQIAVDEVIPDFGAAVTRTFVIDDSNPLESVEIDISLGASPSIWWGDYNILLTSPSGTTSQLAYRGGEPGSFGMTEWEFSSAEFWGEDPSGRWTLSVEDDWAIDEATWNSFEFTGYAEILELATLAGDFDGDGDVDGVDFWVWQAGYPTASGGSLGDGDADGDGDVDGVDLGIWQANYPNNVGGSAAIPEPATLFVMLAASLPMLLRSSRPVGTGSEKPG